MHKAHKIFAVLVLIFSLTLLVFTVWTIFQNRSPILEKLKSLTQKSLPQLAQNAGTISNPGTLLGPQNEQHSEVLDPDKVIAITNDYRKENGLPTLTKNNRLASAAQNKNEDMLQNQYFEHISPTGVTPAELVTNAGYQYRSTGENLALGDFKDEKDLVDAWMASPGHRANILKTDYTEIGVATKSGTFENRLTWLAVQEFGTPAPNCALPVKNLETEVETAKTQYTTLLAERDQAFAESQTLTNEANTKIKEGNRVYKESGDTTNAQPYWDDGTKLRDEANKKFAEVKTLEEQLNALYATVNDKTEEYNTQVNVYNNCIK